MVGTMLEAKQWNKIESMMDKENRALVIRVFVALLLVVANGSFTIFSKICYMWHACVSILIFNFWT